MFIIWVWVMETFRLFVCLFVCILQGIFKVSRAIQQIIHCTVGNYATFVKIFKERQALKKVIISHCATFSIIEHKNAQLGTSVGFLPTARLRKGVKSPFPVFYRILQFWSVKWDPKSPKTGSKRRQSWCNFGLKNNTFQNCRFPGYAEDRVRMFQSFWLLDKLSMWAIVGSASNAPMRIGSLIYSMPRVMTKPSTNVKCQQNHPKSTELYWPLKVLLLVIFFLLAVNPMCHFMTPLECKNSINCNGKAVFVFLQLLPHLLLDRGNILLPYASW